MKKKSESQKVFYKQSNNRKSPHTKDINQGNLRKRKYSVCENVKASRKRKARKYISFWK